MRPRRDCLERVAIRMVESKIFSMLVIDARSDCLDRHTSDPTHHARDPRRPRDDRTSLGGRALPGPLKWQRTIRRLSLLVEQLPSCILLLTSAASSHTASLPVAMRIELHRHRSNAFELYVAKNRTGRAGERYSVPCDALLSDGLSRSISDGVVSDGVVSDGGRDRSRDVSLSSDVFSRAKRPNGLSSAEP